MSKVKFKQGVCPVKGSPGKFDINYQVKGKRITKTIAASNFEDALSMRLTMKSALRKKNEGAEKGETVATLDEALAKVTEKIKNEIASGYRNSTSLSEVLPPFQRFFFDYPKSIGKNWLTIKEVTPDDLEGYKAYYRDVIKKPEGLSSEVGKIQSILTHLYKLKLITSLQLFEFRQVRRLKKNVRPFIMNPDSDFIKVLLWIKNKKPRLFEFLSFLASTGRRPREVRSYKREQVDLENNYINIPDKTKNKIPSKILLDAELKKIVVRAMEFSRKLDSEYLFLNDLGRKFSANKPQENFKKAAKACEIHNWNSWAVYQLKKRFITVSRAAGMSAEAIAQVTGHKDLNSVMHNYSFPDKSQSDKVLQVGRLKV